MKKLLLLFFVAVFGLNTSAQTFKLETVSQSMNLIYLSHLKPLGVQSDGVSDSFILWAYKQYNGDSLDGYYEIEVYRGDAHEMLNFLNDIYLFTEKHKGERNIVTNISGVKVKTHSHSANYILIYDKDQRDIIVLTKDQLSYMIRDYVNYRKENNI